jgi:hypothetical protein
VPFWPVEGLAALTHDVWTLRTALTDKPRKKVEMYYIGGDDH